MTWEIEFSIGPVQGFVAQSRRTRDLWGSSYLLSYLAAHAMQGAAAHGAIVRPRVAADPLYQWVCGHRDGQPPRIGSVPNHFAVESDADPARVAESALVAFRNAWQRVCDAIWHRYLERVSHLGDGTAEIWKRQVERFWEITWVAAAKGETSGLLARRKHWRTHRLPEEPGDKCTVMPDFQELSGHVRAAGGAAAQEAFWDAVRRRAGELNVRDRERLCAPALVKRLFATVSQDAIRGELDVDHWPSTLYVGALPWLHQVREQAATQAKAYVERLRTVAVRGTIRNHVPLAELEGAEPADFFKLDANYYHHAFLASSRLAPLTDEAARSTLVALLREVCQAAGGGPPVYYALLLADGDRLGELVAQLGSEPVGRALSAFGAQVPQVVREHHGVTVYAGGDDVLAMLPVPDALRCADRLAAAYTESFNTEPFTGETTRPATLSAAVVFAHVRMPLGGVLAHARTLLEDVAKDANGRDSLAVAVLKPGGPHCQWVTTWTRRYPDGRALSAIDLLDQLSGRMRADGDEPGFSSSLLHHTCDTLSLLCGMREWSPGQVGDLPAGLDLKAYVRAEVVDSWEGHLDAEPGSADDIGAIAQLVVDLVSPAPNPPGDSGSPPTVDAARAGVDALLLARFVAAGGREEDHR